MLPQLYVLADEYLRAAEVLADANMPPEVLKDTLESLSGDVEVKATNVAMMVRNFEALAAQIKDAENQMVARRKSLEHQAEALREYLLYNMRRTGISEVQSPWFKVSIKKNPPSVEILAAGQVPEAFMRQPETPPAVPNLKAIADHIKAGNDAPWARLTQGERVDIK